MKLYNNEHTTIQFGYTEEADGNMALHTGDNPTLIISNREQFGKKIKAPLSSWVLANQTHSLNIYKVTKEDIGRGSLSVETAIDNCDALYTYEKDVLLGVFTADCLPIIIYDKNKNLVCAIHSGWVATVQAFLYKVVQHLMDVEGCNKDDLMVFFGPSIHQTNFQAKRDILDKIVTLNVPTTPYITYESEDSAFIDLIGINKEFLYACDMQDSQIQVSSMNTYIDGFSYRKDKTKNRHLSFIINKV